MCDDQNANVRFAKLRYASFLVISYRSEPVTTAPAFAARFTADDLVRITRVSDPQIAPDGKSIVLSLNNLGTISNQINILDLETQRLSPLPSAENLFSPRWSPDGRYIAAITLDSDALMLFDLTNQQWTELARMGIGYPSWSHDGQYLYFDSILTEDPAFFRVRISDRHLERLVSLKDIHRLWGLQSEWTGLAPDDSLLVTRDIGSPEIYALDWQP